ncbi:MAG: HAMP domain-containing histidine kinase [Schleiferiaceae bacterium]|nr:HAMP domain-containing histidine kinase [Schleiferiaceae bacterium]
MLRLAHGILRIPLLLVSLFVLNIAANAQKFQDPYNDSVYFYLLNLKEGKNLELSRVLGDKKASDSLKYEIYGMRFIEMEAMENYWYAAKCIVDQGIILEHLGAESDKVLAKFKDALAYSEKHKDTTNIVWSAIRISKHYLNTGKLNHTEELYYTQFIIDNIEARMDPEVRYLGYNHLANRHLRYYDFKTALTYYNKSYELAKVSRNPGTSIFIGANILSVKNQYKDTLGVKELIQEIENLEHNGKKIVTPRFYIELSKYSNLFSLEERLDFMSIAEETPVEKLNKEVLNNYYHQKCELLAEQENPYDLRYYLEIFLKNLNQTPPTQKFFYPSQIEILFGKYYQLIEEDQKAIDHFEKSLKQALILDAPVLLEEIYQELYKGYQNIGDYKNAFHYLNLYNAHVDKVFSLNKVKEIEDLIVRYETDKKQQTIDKLQVEKEFTAFVSEQKSRDNRILRYFILALVLLSSLMVYLYVQNRIVAKKLKKLNVLKDNVFSVLSHDIRSPLNTFKSLLSISDRRELTTDEYKKYLEVVHTEVGQTSQFLESILKWAQANQNILPISQQSIDLSTLLFEVKERVSTDLKDKRSSIKILDDQPVIINSDKDLLNFIIRNITYNAVKFSPSNSEVKIMVIEKEQEAIVSIEDHGKGMTQEQIKQFYRGDMTASLDMTGEKSTGLGLALCRDFAKRLQISIQLNSEPNKGSTFTLHIPK